MREKRPIIYSILIFIGAFVTFLGIALFTNYLFHSVPALEEAPFYLMQVVIDLGFFTVALFYMKKTGYIRFFKEWKTGFFQGLFVGGFFLFTAIFSLIVQVRFLVGKDILPVQDIFLFILTMFLVGLAEETVFRGVISNILYESFKGSAAGVKLSVLLSGILFGLFHMVNAVGTQIKLSGVITQVLITSVIGMLSTSIYYRTRNLWVLITLHALSDIAGSLVTSILGSRNTLEVIGEYSDLSLVSFIPYAIAIAYLLRKSKMEEMIEREKPLQQSSTLIDGERKVDMAATLEKDETKDYTKVVRIVLICYILVIIVGVYLLSAS